MTYSGICEIPGTRFVNRVLTALAYAFCANLALVAMLAIGSILEGLGVASVPEDIVVSAGVGMLVLSATLGLVFPRRIAT